MTGVDQYFSLWSRGLRQEQRHSPISNIRVIKRRLERLVLHQHPLIRRELCMQSRQPLFKPALAMANIRRPRIVRTVREPQRDVTAPYLLRDPHAVKGMLHCRLAFLGVGIAERSIFV